MPFVLDMPPQDTRHDAHRNIPRMEIVRMVQANDSLEAAFAARARTEGWSYSQAEWIGKLGLAALDGETNPDQARLDAAYKAGERRLSAGYFENALSQGKSRLVAFLTVIDLEKQVIERAGGTAPDYGDDALKAAYAALEQAAAGGASTEDQIATAFATLRTLEAQKAPAPEKGPQ